MKPRRSPLVPARIALPVLFLMAAALLISPNVFAQTMLPYPDPKLPVEQRVQDLLSRMTLQEKVAQLEGFFDLLVSCHVSLPGLKPLAQATTAQLQLMQDTIHVLRGAPHLHSIGLEMMRAESLEELKKNLTIFTGLAA